MVAKKNPVKKPARVNKASGAIMLSDFGASANFSGNTAQANFGTSSASLSKTTHEVPTDFKEIGKKANEYYRLIGPAKSSINTWVSFAIGSEVRPVAPDDYIQRALDNFVFRTDMDDFVKDMTKQLLIKGEYIGYALYGERGFESFQTVNPVSCDIEYNEYGHVVSINQQRYEKGRPKGAPIPLDLSRTIYAKWDSPSFEDRGTSMLLAAFENCEILRAYKRADLANANRWATPFRQVKIGGELGGKVYLPDQAAIQAMVQRINAMNPEAGLVTNCLVSEVTDWPKGNPSSDTKIEQLKNDIVIDCGLSRTVVTGEGANYATAKVAMEKFVTDLGTLQGYVEKLIEWCVSYWDFAIKSEWSVSLPAFDLSDKDAVYKLMMELFDRGMVSRKTIQMMADLEPETEDKAIEEQKVSASADTNMTPTEIANLVALNVMTPDEARGLLGLNTKPDPMVEDQKTVEPIYEQSGKAPTLQTSKA